MPLSKLIVRSIVHSFFPRDVGEFSSRGFSYNVARIFCLHREEKNRVLPHTKQGVKKHQNTTHYITFNNLIYKYLQL